MTRYGDMKWGPKPDYFKFFPYDSMRKNQKTGIPKIYDFLSGGKKIFALKAPTGSGKEAMFMTPIVHAIVEGKIDRAIVMSPTTMGIQQDAKELKRIVEKHGAKLDSQAIELKLVVASSKSNLCKIKAEDIKDGEEPKAEIYESCSVMVKKGLCPFHKNINTEMFGNDSLIDFNDENTIKKCGDSCPYYTQLEMFKKANIIVCDFNYVIKKFIKEKVFDFDFSKTALVFNEAHMVPKRAMFENRLSLSTVDNAIKELWKMPDLSAQQSAISLLINIKNAMKALADSRHKQIKQDRLEPDEDGFAKITMSEAMEKIGNYEETIETLKKTHEEMVVKGSMFSWTGKVVGFFNSLNIYYSKHMNTRNLMWVSEERPKGKKVIRIGVTNTNAFILMADVIEEAYKVIFYSATIYEKWLKALLGLYRWGSNMDYVELANEFPEENRTNIVIPKFRIMRSRMDARTAKAITKEIVRILRNCKGKTCIIMTNGVAKKIEDGLRKKMPDLFKAPTGIDREAKKVVIERLKTEAHSMMSPYGSSSTSIDISEVDNAIVVGVATPKYNLIHKTIVRNYSEHYHWSGGTAFFLIMTLFAVLMELQSVGRFQRNEKDKINIYWMDERYESSLKGFIK